jgi:hypothetical protein
MIGTLYLTPLIRLDNRKSEDITILVRNTTARSVTADANLLFTYSKILVALLAYVLLPCVPL